LFLVFPLVLFKELLVGRKFVLLLWPLLIKLFALAGDDMP
jgi:hypothetical protein